jgi:hypothetical protein
VRRALPLAVGVVAGLIAAPRGAFAGEPPVASDLRVAFEAQFPKSDANATALELERLAAGIGIDLAPQPRRDPEKPDEPVPPPKDGRARPEPGTEFKLPVQEFLQRELSVADERIGRAAPVVEKFLEEHGDDVAAIESVLLAHEEPRWEIDVALRGDAPIPNLLGHIRLQRLLLARALVLARQGDKDGAEQTMEASWRLHGAVLSRPDLISQLIAVAVARFQSGVLRKIDSPFYDWPDRLRAGGVLEGVLVALQNENWFFKEGEERDGRPGPYGHAWRGFVANVQAYRGCSWDSRMLADAWRRASEEIETDDEYDAVTSISTPNLFEAVLRARRVAIDNELTALVLDARAERAALRRPRWPGRLRTLGAGLCPNGPWSYRVERNGTARFAFEDHVEGGSTPFQLPLQFFAGTPLKRRPTKKGEVVNPPPKPAS